VDDVSGELFDPAAESVVLAAAMDQPMLVPAVVEIPAEAFVGTVHAVIFRAIVELFSEQAPCDHTSVIRRAERHAVSKHQAGEVQTRVLSFMGRGLDVAVGFHIERLVGLARARQVLATVGRLSSRVSESVRLDDPAGLVAAVAAAQSELELGGFDAGVTDADMPESLDSILAGEDSYDWLVPGVLERMDRLILTGFEGTGKSYLLAQIALCIACGLNPFSGSPCGPQRRVLVVDSENSRRQTRRRYRRIRAMVENMCRRSGVPVPDWADVIRFVIRPEGIELNDPRVLARVQRQIAACEPDLVIIGPLYRLHSLNTQDEQAARDLVGILDRLRVKFGFSLLAEAHVNHGSKEGRSLRPTGSSLFLRWPEFGLGLRPAKEAEDEEHPSIVDVVGWRGGREDRVWPTQLHHHFTDLPWLADDRYEQRLSKAGFGPETFDPAGEWTA
jgi:replicative DNA helicase